MRPATLVLLALGAATLSTSAMAESKASRDTPSAAPNSGRMSSEMFKHTGYDPGHGSLGYGSGHGGWGEDSGPPGGDHHWMPPSWHDSPRHPCSP